MKVKVTRVVVIFSFISIYGNSNKRPVLARYESSLYGNKTNVPFIYMLLWSEYMLWNYQKSLGD